MDDRHPAACTNKRKHRESMQWPRDVSVLKSHDKKEKEYSQLGIDPRVVCWPRTFAEEEDEGVTPVPLRFITIRIATTARTIAAPLAPTAICQLLLALHSQQYMASKQASSINAWNG